MTSDKSRANTAESVASMDSTGKRKSFRRTLTRFADKTSMAGVTYINNAKFWWAKVIWCIMLVIAMLAMGLHLWYLFDQYYSWPVQTKIKLGFDNLPFPEITICNTNRLHQRRLSQYKGAESLKALLDAMKPENIAPDQFQENYDFDKNAGDDWDMTTEAPTTQQPPGGNQSPPSPTASGGDPPLKVNSIWYFTFIKKILKVILCASEHICSIVRYYFRSFNQL